MASTNISPVQAGVVEQMPWLVGGSALTVSEYRDMTTITRDRMQLLVETA